MDPERIIQSVYKRYAHEWKQRIRSHSEFAKLLRPQVARITATSCSRLLNGGEIRATADVRQALRDPEVQNRIELALGCLDLFSAASEEDIDRLLVRAGFVRGLVSSATNLVDLSAAERMASQEVLSGREMKAVENLVARTIQGQANVLGWLDPPPVGASLLALATAHHLRGGGVSPFLIQPSGIPADRYLLGGSRAPLPPAFDAALSEVWQRLGISSRPTAARLLDSLAEARASVLVLQANRIAHRTDPLMYDLVLEARGRSRRHNKPHVPIVLFGRPDSIEWEKQQQKFPGGDVAEPYDEGMEFFESQWRRYSAIRRNIGPAQAGESRIKRAREYYTADSGSTSWPSTLRMLAFFASNEANLSYFDPTAGWERLAGMAFEHLPDDIRMHLDEAVQQVGSIPEDRKRETELRAARWCSTAVYWLTKGAAEDLGRRLDPVTALESFNAAAGRLVEMRLVDIVDQVQGSARVYKMEMAVRAIIQQRWAFKDPEDRAVTHHQIASRLFDSRNNKDLLRAEYPVEPHWGRSRMHFLAECLRHLIRTCDRRTLDAAPTEFPKPFTEKIPKAPVKDETGCDPVQVINFCFGVIFWQELNDNGTDPHSTSNNRKLALQNGAYHLTAELLQLMSEGYQLGEPHQALNPEYKLRYLREVGYALLDLGDLAGAKSNFEKLLALARERGAVLGELIQFQLDLTIALGVMGDVRTARQTLAQVRPQVDDLSTQADERQTKADVLRTQVDELRNANETLALAPATAELHACIEEEARIRREHERIEKRLDTREAHLRYLEGNFKGALEVCERIERESDSIEREVAHVYIATLGELGEPEHLSRAMRVCVTKLFEYTSPGLQHEGLGFRVALGHLFRKLGMVDAAEATLDKVYSDVMRYGCSERTYLALLLEAGRTVMMQGRLERAYAAYLRPCFDRATARGHTRVAEAARRYARSCIERLIQAGTDVPDQSDLRACLQGRGEYLVKKRQGGMVDPQYSFEAVSIDRWVARLAGAHALAEELRQLTSAPT